MTCLTTRPSQAGFRVAGLLLPVIAGLGLMLALLWAPDGARSSVFGYRQNRLMPSSADRPGGAIESGSASLFPTTAVPSLPSQPAEAASRAVSALPLRFVANAGQTDPSARFTVQGMGQTIFFTPGAVLFRAAGSEGAEAVELSFAGASPRPVLDGSRRMGGVVNYALGADPAQWRFNVPTYQEVVYRGLYAGVDLVYRGREGHLKSEFRLAAGVDPGVIRMAFRGVEGVSLGADGALVVTTAQGELVEAAPVVYQEVGGVRRQLAGRYILLGAGVQPARKTARDASSSSARVYHVGFRAPEYDSTRPLVIDPVLAYSSYLGGSGIEEAYAVALDGEGGINVVGKTESLDFPTTENALYPDYAGGYNADVFVTRIISASGVYTYAHSTYLGGTDNDYGYDLAVGDDGSVYLTGGTYSDDFPITANALQPAWPDTLYVAFVACIEEDSGVYDLEMSTYLGGDSYGLAQGEGIAVEGTGLVCVTGFTDAESHPTTENAIQPDLQGGEDAFVTCYGRTGDDYEYVYSSYLGGTDGDDTGYDVAVDGAGGFYVTGSTASTDFPTTGNALQPGPGGPVDAFVTYITGGGEDYDYVYSSYLGGSGEERGYGLAPVEAVGVCVAGYTSSSNFFTTTNAIQPAYGLNGDGFTTCLVKLGPTYAYLYSSYLGGSGGEVAFDMARDGGTGAYVVGSTSSDNFPTTALVPQRTFAGQVDAFAAHIVEEGGVYRYDFATYLGGAGNESAYGLAVGGGGGIYLTGRTVSTDFLTTTNAIQPVRGGDWDGFVSWIAPGAPVRAYLPLVMRKP